MQISVSLLQTETRMIKGFKKRVHQYNIYILHERSMLNQIFLNTFLELLRQFLWEVYYTQNYRILYQRSIYIMNDVKMNNQINKVPRLLYLNSPVKLGFLERKTSSIMQKIITNTKSFTGRMKIKTCYNKQVIFIFSKADRSKTSNQTI
ncbi:uncharacterized protein T551_03400 [Pneumocystis jirovecii RU7]|uniref:Uncharacterized protein n=1 Tax=Pneumocystis jirovecii (strain RU7) TaxID=1408657 RepID=A0A0W4ZF40_PNEJ7|nr:uncharacterized protein T551_03400 [Pneumocystis jirovecii RU7]KTW26938.1 hypothetical protein T551_03400 [Pneumocystis jirovecii RU7]